MKNGFASQELATSTLASASLDSAKVQEVAEGGGDHLCLAASLVPMADDHLVSDIIIIIIFVIIIWCPWTTITWSCCWCNILSKTFLGGKKVKVANVSKKVHLVRENMCGSPLWSDSR